jgi:topoisomerase-4 subunit A
LTKGDKRTTYNLIYRDGKSGPSYIKDLMFRVLRDKLYDLTNGNKDHKSSILQSNGEAEVITVILRQVGTIKK